MRRFEMLRELTIAASLAALAMGSTACATKGFVRTSVNELNEKVDTLGQSVEETQERTRRNEGRIEEVDRKVSAAEQSAQRAKLAASEAAATANAAGAKADAVDRASKRLILTVSLSEDQGNFQFGTAELPPETKVRLDQLVAELKADPKGAFFEIEGHTDNVGERNVNDKVGLARAEAVKRYLYEQHQIPLHKINVISYGEDKPVAPNTTPDGRAQNRRVVVKVLI
jgi:outer membrane protein OmpA-like peptidoglycan-associated protein